jgi:hypothetical protein
MRLTRFSLTPGARDGEATKRGADINGDVGVTPVIKEQSMRRKLATRGTGTLWVTP